ncbi:hypothetical protein BDP27DRAFT_577776 [Rhodocollybia butyracea]|uniref:Protein kinase domain-containing protein n=1 Tax=Rhodocollybia butyracea TaxID=206335 RepID=A0A9P5P923_9AGAR|nr:hypothetical protein BDP27DRAFT_577776 [Rhodocollybia butyracea]
MYFCTFLAFLSFGSVSFITTFALPLRFSVTNAQEAGQIPLASPPSLTDAPSPPSPLNTSRPTTFLLPNLSKLTIVMSLRTPFKGLHLPQNICRWGTIMLNISPDRLLVKVLKNVDDDTIAEVKALKMVDQFVASGMLRVPVAKSNEVNRLKGRKGMRYTNAMNGARNNDDLFELKPVIVMLKMAGKPLTSMPEYISRKNQETRRKMMGDTLNLMCNRVGELALRHGFVHRDNIIGNVLVISEGNEVVDVNIIDWGGKYLSSIRDDVAWDDLMEWCHHRWALWVWEEGRM